MTVLLIRGWVGGMRGRFGGGWHFAGTQKPGKNNRLHKHHSYSSLGNGWNIEEDHKFLLHGLKNFDNPWAVL